MGCAAGQIPQIQLGHLLQAQKQSALHAPFKKEDEPQYASATAKITKDCLKLRYEYAVLHTFTETGIPVFYHSCNAGSLIGGAPISSALTLTPAAIALLCPVLLLFGGGTAANCSAAQSLQAVSIYST